MGDVGAAGGQRGYWFPMVLLGFGLLVLLGWESLGTREDFGWFAYGPAADVNQISLYGTEIVSGFTEQRYPMRDSVWAVLVIVVLVGTTAWYGWRARRAGEPIRTYVTVGIAGTFAVVACYLAAAVADSVGDSGVVTSVGLPLVGIGVLAGAWAYLRPASSRRLAVVLSIGCLAVGLGIAVGALAPGLVDPILIAGGLLALARFERSRLLAVVACVVLAAMVVFPTGTFSMLLPATLLLLAGVAALAMRQDPATT